MRIMRQTTQGKPPTLPNWDDWGQLFVDGLRFFVVYLVYMLPMFLIMCCGYVVMVGPMAFLPFVEDSPGLFTGGMLAGYTLFYPLMGISILFSLVLMFLALVAITRMVAHDSLGAAFQLGDVWKFARNGFRNYLLALIAFFGITYIVSLLSMSLAYSIVLLCLLPFLIGAVGWYSMMMMGALFGTAYYHSEAEQPATE
jgi:hypothetical protein